MRSRQGAESFISCVVVRAVLYSLDCSRLWIASQCGGLLHAVRVLLLFFCSIFRTTGQSKYIVAVTTVIALQSNFEIKQELKLHHDVPVGQVTPYHGFIDGADYLHD